ncbi:MAG TPA: cytochrome c oxidase subunit 3 [Polyangiaceae bacterium]|jgi:cytochrome c oxidase subunit 3|nr:cytochrome c oxidase subunit 3 [Polyangiaceae bacterium]
MPSDPSSLRPEFPNRERSFSASSRQIAMIMFLASLAVLFVTSIIAYLVTRSNHPDWSRETVQLPWGLLGAGVFLVGTSVFIEMGLRAIRRNDQARLMRALWWTGASAFAFLVAQGFNWRSVVAHNVAEESRLLSLFIFYMLTGVHALHILAGFIPLGIVIHNCREREYSSSRHEGVALCAQYWHFLGVIWVLLMITMQLA